MRLGSAILSVGVCLTPIVTPGWAKTSEDRIAVADPGSRCPALAGYQIPSSAFGLPTGNAVITQTDLIHQRGIIGSYCRLKGQIAAANSADPAIGFQVNLPTEWNQKTVQYGGGGTNGFVVKGTGYFAGGGKNVPPALSRGYVTYGSDSGHQGQGLEFIANATAFENYSYAAVKRTKDLVTAIVQAYYGRPALRNYHIGGSKGGQEAIQAAQRYYEDFDGVVSYYPAAQNQSLSIAWNRMAHFAFDVPGAALDAHKQLVLKQAVMNACDRLDGAADGIVSDVRGCRTTFNVRSLLCAEGVTSQDCLTAPQVAALEVADHPFVFPYSMPNGVTSVGPFPALLGADTKIWFGNGTPASVAGFYAPGRVFPWSLDNSRIDKATWQSAVLETARVYDASSSDFDGLQKRDGKLIIVQGTLDMLVPNAMTDHFFESVKARYGSATRNFVRYYVTPGFGHGDGAFRMEWDALDALDQWVGTGRAPRRPVATDRGTEAPGRSRPLCEYPYWPKYKGKGSINAAENFKCVVK